VTPEQWETLNEKLGVITRLLALNIVDDLKRQQQIAILDKAGLPPKQIAGLLGTTANTVSVTLSKLRSTKK